MSVMMMMVMIKTSAKKVGRLGPNLYLSSYISLQGISIHNRLNTAFVKNKLLTFTFIVMKYFRCDRIFASRPIGWSLSQIKCLGIV